MQLGKCEGLQLSVCAHAKRTTKRATSPHRLLLLVLAEHLPLTHPLPPSTPRLLAAAVLLINAGGKREDKSRSKQPPTAPARSHAASALRFPCSLPPLLVAGHRLRRLPPPLLRGRFEEMQIGAGGFSFPFLGKLARFIIGFGRRLQGHPWPQESFLSLGAAPDFSGLGWFSWVEVFVKKFSRYGCNGKEREGGDHKVALLRQKKLKAKTFKWRSSNCKDMNGKVEAGGSDEVYDDTVLCSLPTASFSSLVSQKRVRTLGKVAEQCDAVDPPVPRKLRSEEEEAIADVLLSIYQIPSLSEATADKAIANRSNTNVASTSYSEEATKDGEGIVILPNAPNEVASQATCTNKVVEQTKSVTHVNPVPCSTDQSNNINPPLLENEQMKDLSLGIVVNLPSPSKDSNNSPLKQQKVQFDDSLSFPAQKPEAPNCLVNSNKFGSIPHEEEKAKNSSAQERFVGFVKKMANHSLARNVDSTKAWKRSITHVYVSHVIQMHMNKEKASQTQVKPEERPHVRSSRSPNGPAIHKNNARDEKFYTVHFDMRVPVQPSPGMCDMSADRQKIVSGNFLNMPTSTGMPGTQHLQYLHPQMAHRGAMPYPFPHLPYSRGNLAPAAAIQQKLGSDHYVIYISLGELADATAVHGKHWVRATPRPSGELVGHDEAASSADANSSAAADVAVPCFSIPAEAGHHAAAAAGGSVAQHVLAAADDDGHASSPGDVGADGALLRAVPGRKQAASAAQVDLAF
ncbi:hypothetical protein HU200_046700 [Digitaria exilis]|uniref:Uncharacterized protein n=1 Tax=Digitaria exilis TaxID=1010633 RepID=A0A835AVW5_9POAL|nr:hypothetical protein HU200_046700 [Digitaria exilis]